MWFSLFATVLILAITFYQGLQGLFSGMINLILALLSAALAFGFYENLYFAFLVDRQPDYGRAIALVGIFVISLLVLRSIVDALIKDNVHFQLYADRIGGGIFGFLTAMIIVGMLSIGFQMLPFKASFLGFSRFAAVDDEGEFDVTTEGANRDWSKVTLARKKTWLNAGGFTTALASHLSSNALRGRSDISFGEMHPDFLAQAHFAKANPLGPSRLTAEPTALEVVGYWDLPTGELYVRERKSAAGGKKTITLKKAPSPDAGKYLVVRIKLNGGKDEGGDTIRFTPHQMRLLGRDERTRQIREYILAGMTEETPAAQNKLVQVYPGEGLSRTDKPPNEMDLVFNVPESGFEPFMLEFKQDARFSIDASMDKNDPKLRPPPIGSKDRKSRPPRPATPGIPDGGGAESPGSPDPSQQHGFTPDRPGGNNAGTGSNPPSSGRVAVLGAARGWDVSNELPFDLTEYTGTAEVRSGAVQGGRIKAYLDANWQPQSGNKPPVSSLAISEHRRMLQVNVVRLHPGSWLGGILSRARDQIQDFYLVTTDGKQYIPVGVYAIAHVSGRNVFELYYHDETQRDVGAHLQQLQAIRGSHLQGNYAYVFLFMVPPGTKPKEIHTGGTPVDLSGQNIEIP